MKHLLFILFFLGFCSFIQGRTISLNLYNNNAGAIGQLGANEIGGLIPVNGSHWNNIGFNNGTISGTAAQKNETLKDDAGNAVAATFTSTLGSAYVGYSGASQGNGSLGSRDMMHSYLAFKPSDNGHLQITGISSYFVSSGYKVYVYFDTDSSNRTHTLTLTPSGSTPVSKVGDDSGTYSGTFIATTGAGNYANVAIFEGLSTSSFTLEINSSVGRAAVNGIQIVSNDHPLPPTIESFTVNDYYVTPSTPVIFNWETSNATTLSIDQNVNDVTALSTDGNGSINVTVNTTTTYTLTASNAAGSVTRSLRVGAGLPKPNILLFFVDDMGWQDTSLPFHYDANGSPIISALNNRYRTPTMESFATQGMIFTNAYAASVCSPSRVSVMTGMNPTRHRVTNWTYPSSSRKTDNGFSSSLRPPNWRIAGMDETDITLPTLLTQAGYRTIHAGKAHFAPDSTGYGDPKAIGFDINIAGYGGGGPGSYWGDKNYSAAWRGGGTMWDVPGLEQYHGTNTFLTEALTLEMNKAIESSANDGVPFFAYMSHYAVHGPIEEDSRFTANYPSLSGRTRAFATMVEGMDKSLNDILIKLNSLGIAEDTLVIFISDNGGFNGNAPLRSQKASRYEGGIRVPMMVGWANPDNNNSFQQTIPIAQGSREDGIVSCWDLFPTIADIAGSQYSHSVDGNNLLPYFTGSGNRPPQEFFLHFPNSHSNSDRQFYTILREGNWKLILDYASNSYELYDLSNDISESTNLAATESARVMRMSRKMAQKLDTMDAQFPVDSGNNNAIVLPIMPLLPSIDSDNDGVSDNSEDPNRNGLVDPGETDPDNEDSDSDNTNDGDELQLNLDPLNANSFFYLTPVYLAGGDLQITWPSAPGTTFTIRSSIDLSDWTTIVASGVTASAEASTSYNLGTPNTPRTFYRVDLE